MSRIAATIPVLIAFAVSMFGASAAAAGTFTFKPSADTYANQAYPSKSYGSAKRVWAQGASDPFNETFARFTASGITGTVTGAKLRFYVTNGTRNGPSVYTISNSWSENTVAWNVRPATISGPRDDKGTLARNQWVVWDVTPWVTANGTYSFALKQGAADATGFMSRETTKSPTLVITTADPGSRASARPGSPASASASAPATAASTSDGHGACADCGAGLHPAVRGGVQRLLGRHLGRGHLVRRRRSG